MIIVQIETSQNFQELVLVIPVIVWSFLCLSIDADEVETGFDTTRLQLPLYALRLFLRHIPRPSFTAPNNEPCTACVI